MKSPLIGLEPKSIWKHFSDINTIPRASKNEGRIIQYMVEFGNSLGLETIKDAIGNVLIKKPATLGKERCKTVVLQGHLDMVHQKETSVDFDFDVEGINMYIDDDWIKANQTTLGADNGIGVAAIMAVLSSQDIVHPPIEALFTIDEEVGMTGALGLKNNFLTGSILLNLDTEEEDEIIIGCAGGTDVEVEGNYEIESLDAEEYFLFQITVEGLTGGHSGMDIHLNRGNAIKILVDVLQEISSKLSIHIQSLQGGNLTNVIPRKCEGVVAIDKEDNLIFERLLTDVSVKMKESYQMTDSDLSISYKRIDDELVIIASSYQDEILEGIQKMPNGVYSMTSGFDNLVQSSNNIAKITLGKGAYCIACHTRSSVDTERDELVEKISHCFSKAHTSSVDPYPGWTPNPKSEILQVAESCYEKSYGKKAQVKSIHAGLECGIISNIYPTMEMISFGPNIRGAHTPQERLQISSTKRFWKFLVSVLEAIT